MNGDLLLLRVIQMETAAQATRSAWQLAKDHAPHVLALAKAFQEPTPRDAMVALHNSVLASNWVEGAMLE